MTRIGAHSQHWPCSPGLPHPIPLSLSLSLSLSTPIPFLWDLNCFAGTPNPRKHHSLTTYREIPLHQHASNCHPPPANLPSRSSLLVGPPHMQSHDLSHFLEILALGLGSFPSLGTGFPTRDSGPLWWRHFLWVLHISLSLSPEDLIFWGCPPYLSSGQASPWELDRPKFLQTPHWDVSWPTLGPST
jgi:hypothetical protein